MAPAIRRQRVGLAEKIVAEIEAEECIEVVERGTVGESRDGVAGQVEAGEPRECEHGLRDGLEAVPGEVEVLEAALEAGKSILG